MSHFLALEKKAFSGIIENKDKDTKNSKKNVYKLIYPVFMYIG